MGNKPPACSENFGNDQTPYNEGSCRGNRMCKNYDRLNAEFQYPKARCDKKEGVCNCKGDAYQLKGRCCRDLQYNERRNKYSCLKGVDVPEGSSCYNDQTCKNPYFLKDRFEFACPDAKCTSEGCDCGSSCKKLGGVCCRDVVYDVRRKQYVCVEKQDDYPRRYIHTVRYPKPFDNTETFSSFT